MAVTALRNTGRLSARNTFQPLLGALNPCVMPLEEADLRHEYCSGHRQCSHVQASHSDAEIDVATVFMNNLPPVCSRPLVVRTFQPLSTFVASVPDLLLCNASKARPGYQIATNAVDFALMEGLRVCSLMLQSRATSIRSIGNYVFLITANDIATTGFWDEELTTEDAIIDMMFGTKAQAVPEAEDNKLPQSWMSLADDFIKANIRLGVVYLGHFAKLSKFQELTQDGKAPQALPCRRGHNVILFGLSSLEQALAGQKRAHGSRDVRAQQSDASMPPAKRQKPNAPIPAQEGLLAGDAREPAASLPSQFDAAKAGLQSFDIALPSALTSGLLTKSLADVAAGQSDVPASELLAKRQEVQLQMRNFMQQLADLTKSGQISLEKAKTTAEKVKTEAIRKLQLLDTLQANALGQQHVQAVQSVPSAESGSMSTTPVVVAAQQTLAQPQVAQFTPPPSMSPQKSGQQITPIVNSNVPLPQKQQQQRSIQSASSPQAPSLSAAPLAASPQKVQVQVVWTGPVQWTLIDPVSKQRRELAFYVNAIPLRSNALNELNGMHWPQIMEISNIAPMQIVELQKYAQDNKIQVIQLMQPDSLYLQAQGISKQQNDSLYQLLARSLEGKSSVAIVKLPAANRGIVIVALPGQNRLVGLLFLNAPLPTKIPMGNGKTALQSMTAQSLDQQAQQASRNGVAPVFDQYNQLASMQQTMLQQNAPMYGMAPAQSVPALNSTAASGGITSLAPSAASAQAISDAQFQEMLASLQR